MARAAAGAAPGARVDRPGRLHPRGDSRRTAPFGARSMRRSPADAGPSAPGAPAPPPTASAPAPLTVSVPHAAGKVGRAARCACGWPDWIRRPGVDAPADSDYDAELPASRAAERLEGLDRDHSK